MAAEILACSPIAEMEFFLKWSVKVFLCYDYKEALLLSKVDTIVFLSMIYLCRVFKKTLYVSGLSINGSVGSFSIDFINELCKGELNLLMLSDVSLLIKVDLLTIIYL